MRMTVSLLVEWPKLAFKEVNVKRR
jgi:hypothetical protein